MRKFNRGLLYFFCLFMLYGLCGCGKNEPEYSFTDSFEFINGSETFVSESGDINIRFTYRAEEKVLSFIANEDWTISISSSANISDWLTITFEDNRDIDVSDTENYIQLSGKRSKTPYNIRFKTEENNSKKVYAAYIRLKTQSDNTLTFSYDNIVKCCPLVDEHDINISYAGGIFRYKAPIYLPNKEWIITNLDNNLFKVLPNKTGVERKAKIALISNNLIDTLYITQGATKVSKHINVSPAGSLPNLLTAEEKYQITDLTLTGNLNGDDIRYLREMGGKDYAKNDTKGVLTFLDLSGTNIVSGGKPYYYHAETYNNHIGDYMFSELNLVSVILPNSINGIGGDSFSGCLSLSSIKFPSDSKIEFKFIGGNSFSDCISLQSIEIPEGITYIPSDAFSSCKNLKSVKLSDNIVSISDRAFYGCSKLSEIKIPNKVTNIGNNAFCYCTSLTEITLPENIETLGYNVFKYCINLYKLRCRAVEPPLLSEQIGIEEYATLYVPMTSLAKYKDAAIWKNFKNIVVE